MKPPAFWIQKQALPFFDVYNRICALHPRAHVVSWELLTAICFEETSFCNRMQAPSGPGTGFGQVQVHKDDDKPKFFAWLAEQGKVSDTDPAKIRTQVLSDNSFSLEIVCLYAQFKVSVNKLG